MKYRDIPWGVALAVLPGKIIGCFVLNPLSWVEKRFETIAKSIFIIAVLFTLFGLILVCVNAVMDGAFMNVISRAVEESKSVSETYLSRPDLRH
jgi:fructose-specific phosphotransferase system IIC component